MSGTIERTLENLEHRWQGSDREVLRPAFRLLAEGRAWNAEQLAARLGLPETRVSDALRFPRIGRSPAGDLVELFGFRLTPTWHRVDVGARSMFACCALVAHSVPCLLETEVTIVSVDPVGREVIEMRVAPDGVRSVTADSARATFPVSTGPWEGTDVAQHFCGHTRHFASAELAARFAETDSRRRVVTLDELHALAADASGRVFSA